MFPRPWQRENGATCRTTSTKTEHSSRDAGEESPSEPPHGSQRKRYEHIEDSWAASFNLVVPLDDLMKVLTRRVVLGNVLEHLRRQVPVGIDLPAMEADRELLPHLVVAESSY